MVFLYYLVLTLHVIACLFLIAVVLLQQGKGQDLASAFGGGGTQAAYGPRRAATLPSRATTLLAGLFMVTSFSLSILKHRESTILDRVPAPAAAKPSPSASPLPLTPASIPSAPPAGESAPSTAAPGTTPASPETK